RPASGAATAGPCPGPPARRLVPPASLLRIEPRAAHRGRSPDLSSRAEVLHFRPVALLRPRRIRPLRASRRADSRTPARAFGRLAAFSRRRTRGATDRAERPVLRGARLPRPLPHAALCPRPGLDHMRLAPYVSLDAQFLHLRPQPMLPSLPELPVLREFFRAHAAPHGKPGTARSELLPPGLLAGGLVSNPSLVAALAALCPGGHCQPGSRASPHASADRLAPCGRRGARRSARASGDPIRLPFPV